jgi:hypothetical protein
MKNRILKLLLSLAIIFNVGVLMAQSSSYLDTVYAATSANVDDELQGIKDSIYMAYGIEILDEPSYGIWSRSMMEAVEDLLSRLPEDFISYTKAIYLEPTSLQYEIKYDGFGGEGVICIGGEAKNPSVQYLRRYADLYENGAPSQAWLKHRLQNMVLRGMTYGFIQGNLGLMSRYGTIVNLAKVSGEKFYTRLFTLGAESNMVVGPEKTHAWVDLAFAVEQYCTNIANFRGANPTRYEFVKDYVMGGASVSGWQNTQLITTDVQWHDPNPDPEPDPDTPDPDNPDDPDNPGGNVDPIEDRDAPEIPDGDYLPVVTDVDPGDGVNHLPAEQKTMPEGMKTAIRELFGRLPKYYSTCTQAIAYVPSTDTEVAFSQESYVFVTQNSWFTPSFVDLTAESQGERFKLYLLKEMTSRFLYFHGSVITRWKEEFDPTMSTFDAYTDIQQAVVMYYSASNYFKTLNADRYAFIKNYLMKGIEY